MFCCVYDFVVVTIMSFCDVDIIDDCGLCMFIHTHVFINIYLCQANEFLALHACLGSKIVCIKLFLPVNSSLIDRLHKASLFAERSSKSSHRILMRAILSYHINLFPASTHKAIQALLERSEYQRISNPSSIVKHFTFQGALKLAPKLIWLE